MSLSPASAFEKSSRNEEGSVPVPCIGTLASRALHPDKTRLIEFGRFAAQNCEKRGRSKPETFKFLGFVLICDKTRRGDFRIRRKSRGDRMRTTLARIKEALRRRRHRPIPETGKWLAQVVGGYFAYHAVPTNGLAPTPAGYVGIAADARGQ